MVCYGYQIGWQIDLPEITRRKHQNHMKTWWFSIPPAMAMAMSDSASNGDLKPRMSGVTLKLPDDMGLTEPNLWKVWVCDSCFSKSIGMLMYYVSLCIAQTYHAQKIGHPRAAITHPVRCITLSFLALVGYMAMRECRARYPKHNIS